MTWQFLQGAALRGTHERPSPSHCERTERFFFHRTNHHYSILFLQDCNTVAATSLPSAPAGCHLSLLCWKWTFHFHLPCIASILSGSPRPPSELTRRQRLWWAVVLFQAPQAGKLCQSESLCFLITAVRCKPKLAIRKVTFILFPALFLCPWLPELRFFFSSASSAWIQKWAEWSSYSSFKLTWKLPEFRLLLRIFTICTVIYILNLLDSSGWHEQSSSVLWVIPRSDEKLVTKSGVSVVQSCLFIIKALFSISIG